MNRNKLICLLLTAMLLCLLVLPVSAAQTPDLTRTGSIRLTLRYQGQPVGGGELTLYQVATVRASDGGYVFDPVAGLEEFTFSAQALAQVDLAARVLARGKEAGLSGQTKTVGADGTVRFEGLSLGLYVLEQKTAAPGFTLIRPFLVSIPLEENGELVYDVDATPKPEPLLPGPLVPTEPDPTDTTDETEPSDTLPQTGQLNWPIPVLLVLGCTCLVLGLLLLRPARKERK